MGFYHTGLAEGKWFNLPFVEQMAHIGSEVERAINWKNKNDPEYSKRSLERALELLYLTIEDPKNKIRIRELTRLREFLIDYFYFENAYHSSDAFFRGYFYPFNYAVCKKKGL